MKDEGLVTGDGDVVEIVEVEGGHLPRHLPSTGSYECLLRDQDANFRGNFEISVKVGANLDIIRYFYGFSQHVCPLNIFRQKWREKKCFEIKHRNE